MTRSASVEIGEGLRLEYVIGRRVLRVMGLASPVEVSVEQLVALGVTIESATHHFIFFGGEQIRGGSGDLKGVFQSEEAAKGAFHRYRMNGGDGAWGEVVKIDARGRARQVCWFGSHGYRTPAERGSWWKRR